MEFVDHPLEFAAQRQVACHRREVRGLQLLRRRRSERPLAPPLTTRLRARRGGRLATRQRRGRRPPHLGIGSKVRDLVRRFCRAAGRAHSIRSRLARRARTWSTRRPTGATVTTRLGRPVHPGRPDDTVDLIVRRARRAELKATILARSRYTDRPGAAGWKPIRRSLALQTCTRLVCSVEPVRNPQETLTEVSEPPRTQWNANGGM